MCTSSLGWILYRLGSCVTSFRIWWACGISSRYMIKRSALMADHRNTPTLLFIFAPYFTSSLNLKVAPWRPCCMFWIVCIGRPVVYSGAHSVLRFTQSKALDMPISIILVLGVHVRMACSICIMASIVGNPFLYPNWLLDVRRCRIHDILLV